MNSSIWKIFAILLIWSTNAFCQSDANCKAQNNLNRLYSIELEDTTSKDNIIAVLSLNESENNLKVAKNYISSRKNVYFPILTSLYLNATIKNGDLSDSEVLEILVRYKNMESNNCFPFYLLSCYYAQKGKYQLSLKYLSEGNRQQKCERYLGQKADILIRYLINKKESELTAYSAQNQLYAAESFQVYRKLSQSLLKSNLKKAALEEILKMGEKLGNCSYSVLDKLISNAIQCDIIKKSVDPLKRNRYDQLVENRRAIMQLSNKINEKMGENDLLYYLHRVKEIGELAAAKEIFGEGDR